MRCALVTGVQTCALPILALRVNTSAMRLGFALCLFASLGSCGGGGGSGGGVSSTPTPPSGGSPAPTIDYDTAEYQRSTGSVAMDAIAAYDAGATGRGITVAVIDRGIDPGSAQYAGRISAASRDMIKPRHGLKGENGHGTAD